MTLLVRSLVILGLAGLGAALLFAVGTLPPAAIRLADQVAVNLAASGVSHPVTAVLLNFRGYDTFLEVAVLIIALLGMLAAGLPPPPPAGNRNAMLPTLARLATPLMILAAVYLLWAGAFRPGGAFQAAAVLAAAAVLLHLAEISPAWAENARSPRLLIAAGFLFFLFIAAALLTNGALLQYPNEHAGLLIVLIESGLTVSLAVNLAACFLLRAPGSKP